MKIFVLASAIALALITGHAKADKPAALTYEQFETAIPHIDLETCPENLPQTNSFCRATLHHEEIHVFAFAEDGDSPMIGFASFGAERLGNLLK